MLAFSSMVGIKAWEIHNTPTCPHKGRCSLTVAEANYSEVQHHQVFIGKLIKDSFIPAECIKAVFVNCINVQSFAATQSFLMFN